MECVAVAVIQDAAEDKHVLADASNVYVRLDAGTAQRFRFEATKATILQATAASDWRSVAMPLVATACSGGLASVSIVSGSAATRLAALVGCGGDGSGTAGLLQPLALEVLRALASSAAKWDVVVSLTWQAWINGAAVDLLSGGSFLGRPQASTARPASVRGAAGVRAVVRQAVAALRTHGAAEAMAHVLHLRVGRRAPRDRGGGGGVSVHLVPTRAFVAATGSIADAPPVTDAPGTASEAPSVAPDAPAVARDDRRIAEVVATLRNAWGRARDRLLVCAVSRAAEAVPLSLEALRCATLVASGGGVGGEGGEGGEGGDGGE
eukprot:604070-Prymnesium_polylepis.3